MYTVYPTSILRHFDGASIPIADDNTDYMAFKEWRDAGGIPDEYQGPTHAELVEEAKAATRIQRQPIISVLSDLQISAIALGQTSRAQVIETAKQGLRDITDTDLSDCTTFEDMRLKIKNRYIQLATALPADVRKAFSEAIN
jgi:hypothetical protein